MDLSRAFDTRRSGLVESLTRADGCETVAGWGGQGQVVLRGRVFRQGLEAEGWVR